MEYATIVLCFVYCINSGDSQKTIAPTPALKMPSSLMSTDPFNPLKLNIPLEPKVSYTIHDVLNPTPMLKQLKSTGVAGPEVSEVPVKKLLSTTFIDEPLIRPTPVLNLLMRLKTGADSPIATNVPLNPQMSTGVVNGDGIKPTSAIFTATTTAALPLAYDAQTELRPSTGVVDRYFIEPSQVMTVGAAVTTQYDQGPNQVPESINDEITLNMAQCNCKYSEETHEPILGLISLDTGNALTPPSLTTDGSKSDLASMNPPKDIRQVILNLQLNLYVNNIPVLAAQAVPLYF